MARRLPVALALAACASLALAAPPRFSFEGRTLTVVTDRYELQVRDGAIVALRTMLPRPMSLTLRDGPIDPAALPTGLCSLAGHDQEARDQHHPWNVRDLDPAEPIAFPAQHAPAADSEVSAREVPGGMELTYRGLDGDPDATLIQRLTVDAATGDLVIDQRVEGAQPGVVGISLALPNLRGDIELVVPYFGGQRFGERFAGGRFIGLAFPSFWNAGLVVGELPAPGEAPGGSFMLWAQDEHLGPKHLYLRHEGAAQGLALEGMAEAPYEDRTAMECVTWRFNTWAGGWMEPAERFKRWYFAAHRIVPRAQRSPAWMDEIALIWPSHLTDERAAQIAEIVDPSRILLMQWGWLEGFNRAVPTYEPKSADFGEMVAHAHEYGIKVGVYTSCGLIDVQAHPGMVEEMGVDYKYDAPWRPRETPETRPDRWLWYIHPGSARWREFYSGRMRAIVDRYGIDYLYQDVTGGGVGSSGLVEGLGYHEAMVRCEEAIRARVPEAALGGEFWTEVNAVREDFCIAGYLAWDCGATWDGELRHRDMISQPHQPHPLMGYLFNDSAIRWPHNTPIRDTVKFHQMENINEVTGAIPVWTTDTDDRLSEARAMAEKARLWAAGFRPWYPERWRPGAVAYQRNPEGRVVRYDRPGASSLCWEEASGGDRLIYARLNGVGEVALGQPVQIDGWAAYADAGPIGLSPERYYCAFPGVPADLPVLVTALPAGARVVDTRIDDDYVLVAIDGEGAGELRWRTATPPVTVTTAAGPHDPTATGATEALPTHLLVGFAEPARPVLGELLPIDSWDHRIMASGLTVKPGAPLGQGARELAGETHSGVHVMPPAGGAGSEYSIDGYLTLPDDPRLALHFFSGQSGQIGDGVHVVVRVNGREVFRQFRETGGPWIEMSAPLGEYAGQTVLLSLGLDAGPAGFNLSCDSTWWGDVMLVAARP